MICRFVCCWRSNCCKWAVFLQRTNRPCHELRIYASVPPKIGNSMQFSGSERGLQLPLESWFLGPTPTEYPGPEDILPASSRSTRRFHLGKLHVELIDPRSASLSLLKRVGPLPNISFDIEAGWWLPWRSVFIYCTDEHTWTDSQGVPQMGNSETMASSVSFRGNNDSNLSSVWGTRQKKPWHATVR